MNCGNGTEKANVNYHLNEGNIIHARVVITLIVTSEMSLTTMILCPKLFLDAQSEYVRESDSQKSPSLIYAFIFTHLHTYRIIQTYVHAYVGVCFFIYIYFCIHMKPTNNLSSITITLAITFIRVALIDTRMDCQRDFSMAQQPQGWWYP